MRNLLIIFNLKVLRTSKEGLNLGSYSSKAEKFDSTLGGNIECIDLPPSVMTCTFTILCFKRPGNPIQMLEVIFTKRM